MGKSKTQNTHITQNVKHKEYIENLKNIYDLIIYIYNVLSYQWTWNNVLISYQYFPITMDQEWRRYNIIFELMFSNYIIAKQSV